MYFILPVFDAVRMGVRLRVSRDGLGGGTHNEMFSEIVVGRKVLGHGAREGQKKTEAGSADLFPRRRWLPHQALAKGKRWLAVV